MLTVMTNVSIESIKENTQAIKFQTVNIEIVEDKGDSNTTIINGIIFLHSIHAQSHLIPPQPQEKVMMAFVFIVGNLRA